MNDKLFNVDKERFKKRLKGAFGNTIKKPLTVALGYLDPDGIKHLRVEGSDQPNVFYFHEIGGQEFVGEGIMNVGSIPAEEIRFGLPVRVARDVVTGDWIISGKHPRLANEFLNGSITETRIPVAAARVNVGLLTQTEPTPSMAALVTEAFYTYNGTTKYIPKQLTQDFTADAGALTPSRAQFVLVQLNATTGALDYKSGTTTGIGLTFASALAADNNTGTVMPLPDAGFFRVGYVKLAYGMTAILSADHLLPAQDFISLSDAGSTFTGDAGDVPYTPTDSGDWTTVPTNVQEALDTLAADGGGGGTVMTGASSGVDGAEGLVPQPVAGDQDKVLLGDATWAFRHLTSSAVSDVTISSGTITVPSSTSFLRITSETGIDDELRTFTISGSPRAFVIQAASGHLIFVKDRTAAGAPPGNIYLNDYQDFDLSNDRALMLFWNGTNVVDISVNTPGAITYINVAADNDSFDLFRETQLFLSGSDAISTVVSESAGIVEVNFQLNIDNLAVDTTPDPDDDWIATFDTSAGDHKKVLVGDVGRGLTHTYVGYNTVGASATAMIAGTVYMKKITLASAGFLASIGVYIDHPSAADQQDIGCWVLSDDAGTPDLQIALGASRGSTTFFMNSTARWLDLAVGTYLAAGDYWLCVQRGVDSGTDLRIFYDGSGSDKTQAIGDNWSADGDQYTLTSTTNKYSIRGSVLS